VCSNRRSARARLPKRSCTSRFPAWYMPRPPTRMRNAIILPVPVAQPLPPRCDCGEPEAMACPEPASARNGRLAFAFYSCRAGRGENHDIFAAKSSRRSAPRSALLWFRPHWQAVRPKSLRRPPAPAAEPAPPPSTSYQSSETQQSQQPAPPPASSGSMSGGATSAAREPPVTFHAEGIG